MREDTRKALEVLANSEIKIIPTVSGPVRIAIDRFTALDRTSITDYKFIPQRHLSYFWLRDQNSLYLAQKVIPVAGETHFYFGVANGKQEVITMYPDKFSREIWHHDPETKGLQLYYPQDYPSSELVGQDEFLQLYEALMKDKQHLMKIVDLSTPKSPYSLSG